jgi:hypothetical protein
MFTTENLYLAAFLMTRGHTVHVVKLPGGVSSSTHCQFRFDAMAESDARSFESGPAVSAPIYADQLKRLKGLISRAPLTTQPMGAR